MSAVYATQHPGDPGQVSSSGGASDLGKPSELCRHGRQLCGGSEATCFSTPRNAHHSPLHLGAK